MKNHTTPLYRQLAGAGGKTITVVPDTANLQSAIFNLAGLPAVTGDMRNYVQNIVMRLTTVVDTDAAGSAVNFDQLYKCANSFRVNSPLLGDSYPAQHTRGPVVAHWHQILGAGYNGYPQPKRIQIPTNVDADYTVDLYYVLPYSFEGFVKAHETAPFIGWFEQGELEARLGLSTVLDSDYAGAVLKATTTWRAWIEYLPSPDNAIGVPFQFREYIVPGSTTEFTLRGIGSSIGLKGIANTGCGLVALAWLTDATGIGLAGADGVDEINRIDIPFRSQVSTDIVDPYFLSLRRTTGKVGFGGALAATTFVHDGGGWPYTLAATPDNTLANAQAMFLPIIMPGEDFETSKAQHVKGDQVVNIGFGTAPSGSSRFVSLELLEYDVPQLGMLTAAMGLNPANVSPKRKLSNGPATAKQARYTRITV